MDTYTKMDVLVIDTETTGLDTFNDRMLGISWSDGKRSCYSGKLPDNYSTKSIIAHNGKFDAKVIHNALNVLLNITFDTQLAYKLLHVDRSSHLETIVQDVFGVHKKDILEIYNSVTGKKRKSFPDDFYTTIPEEQLAEYACEDAEWTYKIYEYCKKKLEENPDISNWFYNYEMPLCNILILSELKGVRINTDKLKGLDTSSKLLAKDLEEELKWLAGDKELNLNSSKQLQKLLYKVFKLPATKKTKTGFSTDTKTIEVLANKYKSGFCKKLLRYKELTKLISSFTDPLLAKADKNNRIHACFKQIGTKTRRMSCNNPNLQQIPARSEVAGEIRKCFVPSNGYKFLIADYSQIELRLLAHFSKEPELVRAFNTNGDIHKRSSEYISKKLGREFSRADGKLLNFSIIYGKTSFGFAQDWNCTKQEAQAILDSYFELYPGVKTWIHKQQIAAQATNGWFKSLSGLPLYVEGTSSNDKWKFEEAKRQSVNYVIQSSSQDIVKKAIVDAYYKTGLYPLLMIHDELVYEVPSKDHHAVVRDILRSMKTAWELSVPLEVDYKISDYWEK